MKIIEKIVDLTDFTEKVIERDETFSETEARLKREAELDKEQTEAQARLDAKAAAEAKLVALGLDLDDLKALGL